MAIILHELAHAVVARFRGLSVRSITLFALGGVALIEKDSGAVAATEFWMGIAGPVMSVVDGSQGNFGEKSEDEGLTIGGVRQRHQ